MGLLLVVLFIYGSYVDGVIGNSLSIIALCLGLMRFGLDKMFCAILAATWIGMIVLDKLHPFPFALSRLFGTGGLILLSVSITLTIIVKIYFHFRRKAWDGGVSDIQES